MIKAVFFDIDGTLVSFAQKFLPDGLMADLNALRERGIKTFLSTGRALQDLETTGMLRGARFDGYVTINGQFCCDGEGVPFRDRPIDLEDMRGAYQVLRSNPEIPALLEGNGESYLTQINDRVRDIGFSIPRSTRFARWSGCWRGRYTSLSPSSRQTRRGPSWTLCRAAPTPAGTPWVST